MSSIGTKVYNIYNQMGVSATLNNSMICNQLINEGKKVYKLGFGQSPFPVLPQCVEELQKHAFQKDYLNVQGLLELRQSIAEYHNQQNNTNYTAEEVFISPGSKQTLLYFQNCVYNDLLVPSPCWVSHKNQANLLQRHIELIETTKENKYKPTKEQIEAALKTCECDNPILLLNYPNNPTGQTFSKEELKEIASVSDNFLVLSDEIYGNVSFDDHISISKYMPERTITSSGISKWMGAGGWRFGYMIIPESHDELKRAMNNYISESYSAVSAPIQYATVAAYRNFYTDSVQQYINTQKRIFQKLQKSIVDMFRQVGIQVHESQGGFYLYPNFNNFREKLKKVGIVNSDQLCSEILKNTGVATLPSSQFGQNPEEELSMRLCYVDFDGEIALEKGYNSDIDQVFLEKYCGNTLEGCRKLAEWINNL